VGLLPYPRYLPLLLILSLSLMSACVSFEPKKVNAIVAEVAAADNQLLRHTVKLTLRETRPGTCPGVDYPPFIAFRVTVYDAQGRAHATCWGLVEYRGDGVYRAVLYTEDGYSPRPGDRARYYISLRGRNVKWSASLVDGETVLEGEE